MDCARHVHVCRCKARRHLAHTRRHNGKQLYLGSYPSLGMALRAHDLMCLNCKDDPSSFLQLPRCDYSSIEVSPATHPASALRARR